MSSELRTELGKRIKHLRNMKDMTQEMLAVKAKMNPAHIGQIERGEKSPTVDTLEKIANALEVDLAYIFSFENDTSKAPVMIDINELKQMLKEQRQQDIVSFADIIALLKTQKEE